MIYVNVSITDTSLNPTKKPGVAYREVSEVIGEAVPAMPIRRHAPRGIQNDSEIFSAKVSGDHLNETIDKVILILEGMKNAEMIKLAEEHRQESARAANENIHL